MNCIEIGPEMFKKSRTSSDQDRENFRNPGPARIRTETIFEISDQLGPAPHLLLKVTNRTEPDRAGPEP